MNILLKQHGTQLEASMFWKCGKSVEIIFSLVILMFNHSQLDLFGIFLFFINTIVSYFIFF